MKENADYKWVLAIAFFGVIFGGTLAFWLVEDSWTFFDALYMTVISVTTVGYGEVHELSAGGRVVAMIVLISGLGVFGLVIQQVTSYAIGGALGGFVERRTMARKAAVMNGHTIICGSGKGAQALFESISPERCIVVDFDINSEALCRFKSRGIVFIGDPADKYLLSLMRVEVASQVIVVAGDDELNLDIAHLIRSRLASDCKARIVAVVEEYTARDLLCDNLQQQGIESIGLREQSLILLTRELALEWVGGQDFNSTKPISIIIQGSDPALAEVLRVLVMVLQLGGEQKLNLSVFGCSREFVALFKARFPQYKLCCFIDWEEGEFGFDRIPQTTPDFALFAMNSDLRNLELAKRCLTLFPEMEPGRIVAFLENSVSLQVPAMHCLKQGQEELLRVVSIFDSISKSRGDLTYAMDEEGKHLHDQYRDSVDHSVAEWSLLSEFHRNSNRLAALQKDIYQSIWSRWLEGENETKLIEYLAECEHMRWMGFHVMNGYRQDKVGVSREQRLRMKVHPDLIEYRKLEESDKQKDRDKIREALR